MAGDSAYEAARRQREKAERLLRSAELYERGAEGEQQTEAVLSRLPADQWTILTDRRWPGRRTANIDHVVVGPPGVFVIDTKNWSGRISVRDAVLRQNGYSRESTLRAAMDAACIVAYVVPNTPEVLFQPVVCFAREEGLVGWAEGVLVCSTSNLVQMLSSRPRLLSPEQVQQLSRELDAALEPASADAAPTPPAPAPAPRAQAQREAPSRPVPARPSSTRQRKRKKNGAWRLVALMALLAVLLFVPGVVTGVGQAVAAVLVGIAAG